MYITMYLLYMAYIRQYGGIFRKQVVGYPHLPFDFTCCGWSPLFFCSSPNLASDLGKN